FYDPAQATLSPDDVAGACYLYPRQDCTSVDCPAGSACRDGRCEPLCQDQLCAKDEVCGANGWTSTPIAAPDPVADAGGACSRDTDCADGLACATTDSGAGACVADKKPLGASCAAPDDCAGGQCLEGDTDAPICTRLCDAASPVCPENWFC